MSTFIAITFVHRLHLFTFHQEGLVVDGATPQDQEPEIRLRGTYYP
ncbi:hypothetical protein ANO14919_022860 [Xylariales sp. No.14919]|nr:hypothetical protein ANO14919_022860 [Xylariales sp. No.14919]